MKIYWKKHRLVFKRAAGTSRSILLHNDVYYIFMETEDAVGIGECNPLKGLSIDDLENYSEILNDFCKKFAAKQDVELSILNDFPSMKFGFETALLDLKTGGKKLLFPSNFTQGLESIPINGLLWMGSKEYMLEQLEEKIKSGFTCIKMKIGAINFEDELQILEEIRQNYDDSKIEIRVDANGAFRADQALDKLKRLAKFNIHSIEQPIAVNQWNEMSKLVKKSPIAIALDEELIGLKNREIKEDMIRKIKPDFIILKPSLLGGLKSSDEWIAIANENNIAWWLTSALESNIGLNAISQYAFSKNVKMPQGLGTGGLYTNNIASPLRISKGELFYDQNENWGDLHI